MKRQPPHNGGDPRDGPRTNYLGDDAYNPMMRPSVTKLIHKLNNLKTLQDPVNRLYVIRALEIGLNPMDRMYLISENMYGLMLGLSAIPLFEPVMRADTQGEFWKLVSELGVYHPFEFSWSAKVPSKKLNRCRVCSERKQHEFHREVNLDKDLEMD